MVTVSKREHFLEVAGTHPQTQIIQRYSQAKKSNLRPHFSGVLWSYPGGLFF